MNRSMGNLINIRINERIDGCVRFIEMIALIFIFIYFSLFSFQMYIPINNYKFVESSIELNLNQFWMCVCVKHKSSASWCGLNDSARHNKRHRVQHTHIGMPSFAINWRGISISLDPDSKYVRDNHPSLNVAQKKGHVLLIYRANHKDMALNEQRKNNEPQHIRHLWKPSPNAI